jgi:hypothetical protein
VAEVQLYSHQQKAVKELGNGKVLKGGVGTGKSITALAYFYGPVCGGFLGSNNEPATLERSDSTGLPENQGSRDDGRAVAPRVHSAKTSALGIPTAPRDLYVITTARKRDSFDWHDEALAFRIGINPENSVAGIKLTVDSWNNILRYTDVADAFFIFDEQRLVGSGAWVKAFLKIAKANQWIMLSATPGDNWLDYVPVFIANGYYKNKTEFLREHVVFSRYSKFPKVERFIGEGRLLQLRHKLLVDMPYVRHTKRHERQIMVDHDQTLFERVWRDRFDVYKEEPLKDIGAMFQVARKVVNSDPSRLGAVMELFETNPKLIIFYNFDYELEALRTLSKTLGVEVKEWNGHKHEDTPTGDRWLYLVQYAAGNEAWNCITTDTIVFYSLNYSYKVTEQVKGRIDRLNTPFVDLWYYFLRSNTAIDQAINKSLKLKKTFNEKEYIGDKW